MFVVSWMDVVGMDGRLMGENCIMCLRLVSVLILVWMVVLIVVRIVLCLLCCVGMVSF